MARRRKTPETSKIARVSTVAYSRKQKSGGGDDAVGDDTNPELRTDDTIETPPVGGPAEPHKREEAKTEPGGMPALRPPAMPDEAHRAEVKTEPVGVPLLRPPTKPPVADEIARRDLPAPSDAAGTTSGAESSRADTAKPGSSKADVPGSDARAPKADPTSGSEMTGLKSGSSKTDPSADASKTSKTDPSADASKTVSKTDPSADSSKTVSKTDSAGAPSAEVWPEATPRPARARQETMAMPVTAPIGAPPALPVDVAVAPMPVQAGGTVEDPTRMPSPQHIPAGSPDDPALPPGRVPPGDSRSLRKDDEFALIYRIQTFVITRFGVVGRRGQWRVVEYPTSGSASHAYAKECSRFVSEGFSDYRE